ncbi:MAG: hypothetical protein PHY08_06485 [Candidatus Cloacimonetes bacterium]|nr:hypothetical protein [Candidatus Cloacimonadota bacterium]
MLSYVIAKNKPDKLLQLYLGTKDLALKDKIVKQLISLQADVEIIKIFQSEKNHLLSEYLFKKLQANKKFLQENFQFFTEKIQQEIISSLVEKQEDTFLLLLIESNFQELIIEYFINKYVNEEKKLVQLFKNFPSKAVNLSIKSIISHKNNHTIKYMLNSNYKNYLLEFIAQEYQKLSFEDVLWLDEIDSTLVHNPTENRNSKLADRHIDLIDYYIKKTDSYSFTEFITFWNRFINILVINEFVIHHIFYLCSDKQRLYLLMWIYGIDEYIDIPKFRNRFPSIENYYAAVQDSVTLELKEFNPLFDEIFQEAFDNFIFKKAILAFLIDNNRFEEMLDDASIFLDEIINDSEYMDGFYDSDFDYSQKEVNAQDTIKKHIRHLAFLKKYNNLKFLRKYAFKLDDNLICNDFISIKSQPKACIVDLYSFTSETAVVRDINNAMDKIDEHQARLLYMLSNEKAIEKLKTMADLRKNALIKYQDFIFTLSMLSETEKTNPKLTEILGNILIKTEENEVKLAILYYMNDSQDPAWAQYLKKTKIDFNDNLLKFYYYRFITKKGIVVDQDLLIDFLKQESFWINDCVHSGFTIINSCKYSKNGMKIGFIANNNEFIYCNINKLHKNESNKIYNVKDFEFIENTNTVACLMSNNNLSLIDTNNNTKTSDYTLTTDDSKFLLSTKKDYNVFFINKDLKVFSLSDKTIIYKYVFKYFVNNAILSYNNRILLAHSSFELLMVNLETLEENRLSFEQTIKNLCISNDERHIFISLSDRWNNELQVYDIETGNKVYSQKTESEISKVDFSFHCNYFAIKLQDKDKNDRITLYNFNEVQHIFTIKTQTKIVDFKFFKDYPYIAVASDKKVLVYNYQTKLLLKTFNINETIQKIVVSPQSNRLIILTESSIFAYHYIDVKKFACLNLLQTILCYEFESKTKKMNELLEKLETLNIFDTQ